MSLDCECYINPAGEKVICANCQLQEFYFAVARRELRELAALNVIINAAVEGQKNADEIIKEAYRIIREAEHDGA